MQTLNADRSLRRPSPARPQKVNPPCTKGRVPLHANKKILSHSLLFHDSRGRLALWGVASLVRPDVSRCFPIGPQSRSYSESDDVPVFRICIVLAVRGFQPEIQKCGAAHRCALSRWVGDRTNPQSPRRWATILALARLPLRRTHSGSYRLLGFQASGICKFQLNTSITQQNRTTLTFASKHPRLQLA
jgi:hypothetical protein